MPNRADADRVAGTIRDAIQRTTDDHSFRDLLLRLMTRPGRVLFSPRKAKWPAFVLDIAEILGAPRESAIGAAAAVEFAIAAADVIDDLVDDDWGKEPDSWQRALNASWTLTWLAQRCALDLTDGLGEATTIAISRCIADGCASAAVGEYLDLLFAQIPDASEEQALEMTHRKAGALVAMACEVGAIVAGQDEETRATIRKFGGHVGVVAQILNDIAGVADDESLSTDLRLGKKTLPIAYALQCAREERIESLLTWAAQPQAASKRDLAAVRSAIWDVGGVHYAWVVADTHRREAFAMIGAFVRETGRSELRSLRRLVPTTRATRVLAVQP
jgi:geranylgeranyl diphosphate synthase, type I